RAEVEDAVVYDVKFVLVVRLAASRERARGAVERPLVDVAQLGDRQRVARVESVQIAEQPARGIAELAIGLRGAVDHLRSERQIVAVSIIAHPSPQDAG